MEETDQDQETTKHLCKFCNKGFPCGRSLGGHMRCHVIVSTDHNNGGLMNSNTTAINAASNSNDSCYELRKDPKKTIKSKDSIGVEGDDSLVVLDKLCKECGKGFQSWKALFGHMKCHSNKVSNNKNSDSNRDSWTSQLGYKNRVKRSRNRRIKRYLVDSTTTATTTGSSSTSMNANNNQISSNNASTSVVSEIDQEQESEVAMCLMMLSRDEFGPSGLCDSSVLVDLAKVEGKKLIANGSTMKKLAKTEVDVDFLARSEVGCKGFEKTVMKNDEFDDQIESNCGKFEGSRKRKFECVTCNKSFDSYQALGGHKSSHKKLKGCFDSKIQHENEIKHKPMLDHEQTINGYDLETSKSHQESSSFNLGVCCLKKIVATKQHECPICLKMFSSGQALGGHKRSHLIAQAKLNQENNNVILEPVREIRRLLDLNMPPEEEEEEEEMINSSSTIEYKSCYWVDDSDHHNHEKTTLGLLSKN